VVTSKLLHSMRKRGVLEEMIDFVEQMPTNQSTILRFNDHTSEEISLDSGIGQGNLLSMALYQYYNTDILKIPKESHKSAEVYVDDAILIATAKTFQDAEAW
jgi:hypothetical protein